MDVSLTQLIGTALFALAVLHTFLTCYFERLAHVLPRHAGVWHLLGEVEVVFGFWAFVLLLFMAVTEGAQPTTAYLESLNFTEPAFVFVIMVVAASRPVLDLCRVAVIRLVGLFPFAVPQAFYFFCLSLLPLLGSVITEPAAMTLAALMLRDNIFARRMSSRFQYVTLGVLFVNVSIGGTLTHFAAPPILMVAAQWQWDLPYMLSHFGWKALLAVGVNALAATALFRRELAAMPLSFTDRGVSVPLGFIAVHLMFLAGIVYFAHHPVVFIGLFLLFMGVAEAYRQYHDRLMLREGLLVGFFLAGLVTLGALQHWWLQPLLEDLDPTVLFFGAVALTAVTDNAALTYLGSLVEGTNEAFRYALVAGAVTGGGLTVIANAPNPAGFAILRSRFPDGAIHPLGLLAAAVAPTIVAMLAFLY